MARQKPSRRSGRDQRGEDSSARAATQKHAGQAHDLQEPGRRHLVKPLLAGALTGAGILLLVRYVALPFLARELTADQRAWLRDAFAIHTGSVLFAIILIAALLAVPVLLMFWGMMRRRE